MNVSLKMVMVSFSFGVLSACEPTQAEINFASKDVIAISYEAYGMTPTLTPEAIDIAVKHCRAQGGLFANYKGVSVPNMLTAQEVHTFACEPTKTNDSAVIAAQNETFMSAQTAAIIATVPTNTTCSTIGGLTNCTSY